MTKPNQEQLNNAGIERAASKFDLDAALLTFEGAAFRSDGPRMRLATEAAHAALQSHLDAIASNIEVAKRSLGL